MTYGSAQPDDPASGPFQPPVPAPDVTAWVAHLPAYLRPALPLEERDYFAFWRAPRYRWWKSLLAILLAGVVFMLLSGMFGAIGMLIDGTSLLAVSLDNLEVGPGFFIANNLSLAACIPVAMFTAWACVQQPPRWLSSVTGGVRWRWLFLVIAAILPLWILLIGIGILVAPPEGVGIWPHTLAMILGILLTTPLQAAGEEYLVRGLLGRSVAAWLPNPRVGFVLSTVVTVLVFMSLHGADDPWLNAYYMVFGLVGSWLTWRTGGLEAAVAIHVVNNMLTEVTLPFVDMSGMFNRTEGTGDASILINVGVLAVAAVIVEILARRKGIVVRSAPGRAELDATLVAAPAYGPPPGQPPRAW
ncbi:MAG: CPBP family intramembrane glutamic endopeptidase [Propioniciclava sp.]